VSRTSSRRAACAAGRLDGAYWLIGPGSRLPLRAYIAGLGGAYRGGRQPTASDVQNTLKKYFEITKIKYSYKVF